MPYFRSLGGRDVTTIDIRRPADDGKSTFDIRLQFASPRPVLFVRWNYFILNIIYHGQFIVFILCHVYFHEIVNSLGKLFSAASAVVCGCYCCNER